ncbi:hypothetical protein BJ508DRAFT_381039 [Ascobolus immersus RN42]|uniref:Uncharacterized protein n=1 Tax=Ascobolus immersus RN42 TaxID=1160509 RepID=A0A3N4HNU4_ASCIM|nr:hypothetical protein BJ508DRAFT_381039 [Ascobolus immersus RN42]
MHRYRIQTCMRFSVLSTKPQEINQLYTPPIAKIYKRTVDNGITYFVKGASKTWIEYQKRLKEPKTSKEIVPWLGKLDKAYFDSSRADRHDWFKEEFKQTIYEFVFENTPLPSHLNISTELQHVIRKTLSSFAPNPDELVVMMRSELSRGFTRASLVKEILEFMSVLCQNSITEQAFKAPIECIAAIVFTESATSLDRKVYRYHALSLSYIRWTMSNLLVNPLADNKHFYRRWIARMARQNQIRLIEIVLQSSADELSALCERRSPTLQIEMFLALSLMRKSVERFVANAEFRSERLELLLVRYLVEEEVNMQVAKAVHVASWDKLVTEGTLLWQDPDMKLYAKSIYD